MIAVLDAERAKFTATRSLRVLAGVAVLAAGLLALVLVASLPLTQGRTVAELPPADVLGAAAIGLDAAAVVMIVVGALAAGAEYATGSAAPTFLLTPRRGRVVLAKAAVVAAVGALVAVLSAAVCLAVGQGALLAAGLPAAPVELRLLAGSATAPVLYGLAGVCAAFALRSTGAGVATGLALLLAPAPVAWVPGLDLLAPLLPAAGVHGLAGLSRPGDVDHLAAAPAALCLAGWAMLLIGIAVGRVRSRDV